MIVNSRKAIVAIIGDIVVFFRTRRGLLVFLSFFSTGSTIRSDGVLT